MSVQRKNAQRLKRLRRAGVAIDGDYRVTTETLRRLNVGPFDGFPEALQPQRVDVRRNIWSIDPVLQRVILEALT